MKLKAGYTAVATPPTRQGFYEVQLKDGTTGIAEWREYDKKTGKCWWRHEPARPTDERKKERLEGVIGWRIVDKAVVTAALIRPRTLEEEQQHAFEHFMGSTDGHLDRVGYPPENRRLAVGDDIVVGRHKDAQVMALYEGGRVVVYRYTSVGRKLGEEFDLGPAYRAAWWTSVLRKADIQDTHLVHSPVMHGGWFTGTLSHLFSRLETGLDDSPDYQRGYVWTDLDQELYLDSVFNGRELGRFILVKQEYPHNDILLDGKQRLHCLNQFYTSQISYQGTYYHQLSASDRHTFMNRSIQYADLSPSYTRLQLLQIFKEVNAAGVPQTREHLAHIDALITEELQKQS